MELPSKQNSQHVIRYIAECNFDAHNDVVIQCSDGSLPSSSLVLGSLSSILREYLLDCTSRRCIIVPSLTLEELELFFLYLHSNQIEDLYNSKDVRLLQKVSEDLILDSMFIHEFSFSENEDGDEDLDNDMENEFLEDSRSYNDLKCRYCERTYRHVKARNRHMITEHLDECTSDDSVFPCEQCSLKFVSSLGRDKHMVRVHKTGRLSDKPLENHMEITCPHCPSESSTLLLSTLKDLKIHVKQCHPNKDKACLLCGVEVENNEMHEHIQTHVGPESSSLYSCDHCSEKFVCEYHLISHKRNKHSHRTLIQCQYCDKEFKNSKFHANHELKHVNNEIGNEFSCPVIISAADGATCGKVFNVKSNLNRHIRSHSKIKTHKCEECGKFFVDSTRLKEHRWIHSGHRPYQCRYCDKSFRHTNHVRHHEAYTHGEERKYQCHICFKKFVYAYMLKTHIHGAHNYSNQKQEGSDVKTVYQCSLCQSFYDSLPTLESHVCCEEVSVAMREEESQSKIYLEVQDDVPMNEDELHPNGQYVVVYDDDEEEEEPHSFVNPSTDRILN